MTSSGGHGSDVAGILDSRETLRSCFVIAPIGAAGSATRKRSDQILKFVIDPVIKNRGFGAAVRADNISDGGQITHQIIDHILDSDLVVADLTGSNPNVFYELALRHFCRKPFVQLVVGTTQSPLPFDVANQRTIFFDLSDPDDLENAKDQFATYVSSAMRPGAVVESPVTQAIDLGKLRSSDKPEDHSQAEILDRIDEIHRLIVRSTGLASASSPAGPAEAEWELRGLHRLPLSVLDARISAAPQHFDKTGKSRATDEVVALLAEIERRNASGDREAAAILAKYPYIYVPTE